MATAAPSPTSPFARLGAPPVPREHGAWVMLLAPLAAGLVAARPVDPVAAAALVVAAIAAFLAQNAAALQLRPRPRAGLAGWLAIYGGVLAAAGGILLLGPGRWALFALAAPGAALLALHLRAQAGPVRDRLDRSEAGQLLTAAVLALSAPAAWAVARGALAWPAAALWAVFFVGFASGIVHVTMRLEAVKVRVPKGEDAFEPGVKRRLGRVVVASHGALAVAALAVAAGVPAGWMLALAFAPFVVRGLGAARGLAPGVPSFKRIGMAEAGLATWLAAWAVAFVGTL